MYSIAIKSYVSLDLNSVIDRTETNIGIINILTHVHLDPDKWIWQMARGLIRAEQFCPVLK